MVQRMCSLNPYIIMIKSNQMHLPLEMANGHADATMIMMIGMAWMWM